MTETGARWLTLVWDAEDGQAPPRPSLRRWRGRALTWEPWKPFTLAPAYGTSLCWACGDRYTWHTSAGTDPHGHTLTAYWCNTCHATNDALRPGIKYAEHNAHTLSATIITSLVGPVG